jgi:hypothetical protein
MTGTYIWVIVMTIILASIAGNKLKRKNRSLHWLWFAFLSGWIPFIISICLHPKYKTTEKK